MLLKHSDPRGIIFVIVCVVKTVAIMMLLGDFVPNGIIFMTM